MWSKAIELWHALVLWNFSLFLLRFCQWGVQITTVIFETRVMCWTYLCYVEICSVLFFHNNSVQLKYHNMWLQKLFKLIPVYYCFEFHLQFEQEIANGQNNVWLYQYLKTNQHWLTLYHYMIQSPRTQLSWVLNLKTSVTFCLIIVKDCGEDRSPTSTDPSEGEMP